jgi:hypothetical protein
VRARVLGVLKNEVFLGEVGRVFQVLKLCMQKAANIYMMMMKNIYLFLIYSFRSLNPAEAME